MAGYGDAGSEFPQSLEGKIEATAEKRGKYSKGYLGEIGKSVDSFKDEITKAFQIELKSGDDKDLALAVFELQKKLGFPLTDTNNGCDGMFGPYTNKALESFLKQQDSVEQRSKIDSDVDLEKPRAEEKVPMEGEAEPETQDKVESKDENLPEVKMSETVVVGDSLSVGMANSGAIAGALKCYEGGKSTTTLLKYFLNFIDQNRTKINNKQIKRVVILAGVNDVMNFRRGKDEIPKILANLKAMYDAAKSAGLTVIAATIPQFDTVAWEKNWRKVHGDKYPYDAEDLEGRRKQINDFILAQHDGKNIFAVDLAKETFSQNVYKGEYARADGLHFKRDASKKVADYLFRQKGNIV